VIDPSFYQPAGTPAGPTWHGTLHDIAAAVVYTSMESAAVVYSRRFARRYSLTTAGLPVDYRLFARDHDTRTEFRRTITTPRSLPSPG
jgi:hypothetical protein